MKFTSVLIVAAAGTFAAAQDTSTGGGLLSSITNAGSILSSATSAPGKTSIINATHRNFQTNTSSQAPSSAA